MSELAVDRGDLGVGTAHLLHSNSDKILAPAHHGCLPVSKLADTLWSRNCTVTRRLFFEFGSLEVAHNTCRAFANAFYFSQIICECHHLVEAVYSGAIK
jgi:hypothetical protein